MTENEAINVLKMIEAHGCLAIEAKEVAIQALEEIQQYRAIGTVEELKKIEESFNVISDKVWNYILAGEELLERYEAIGTIEEFKDLKEFKKTITEIVDRQLIAGSNNYKETYDCFHEIAKVVQDNY